MRIVWIILVIILALVVWRGLEFVSAAGFFRDLEPKELACVSVGGVIGPEDVTIDRERTLAYLSGYDRRAAGRGEPQPGAIWTYDLSDPQAVPVNVTPWADETFLPHGISLHVDAKGVRRLFVVNHGGGRHTIEILEERGDVFEKVKTIHSEALRAPNDITAVDATRFYVTNDHWYTEGHPLHAAEDFLGLPLTNVLYHDGESLREVAGGLAGANGIHLTADGSTVYVSAARGGMVHVYERDPDTGGLEKRKSIKVPGLPDNIEPGQDGGILVALHPKPLKLMAHIEDPETLSPSQVVRINPASGAHSTLYLDLGEELSGASTAAVHENHLLIGAIAEPKFLDCVLE
ncbi:MAG: SMP-30/gluconolactonase/LRE family protein [Alphaproteobacteria bacterium]